MYSVSANISSNCYYSIEQEQAKKFGMTLNEYMKAVRNDAQAWFELERTPIDDFSTEQEQAKKFGMTLNEYMKAVRNDAQAWFELETDA